MAYMIRRGEAPPDDVRCRHLHDFHFSVLIIRRGEAPPDYVLHLVCDIACDIAYTGLDTGKQSICSFALWNSSKSKDM